MKHQYTWKKDVFACFSMYWELNTEYKLNSAVFRRVNDAWSTLSRTHKCVRAHVCVSVCVRHLWRIFSWPATCGSGCPPAPHPCPTARSQSPQTERPGWAEGRGEPPGTASWRTESLSLEHTTNGTSQQHSVITVAAGGSLKHSQRF